MADDMARKLNAINPDYNARDLSVRVSSFGEEIENPDMNTYYYDFNPANAKKSRIANETLTMNIIYNISKEHPDIASKLYSNHAVVAVDIKEENTTLIIDPTNTLLGVFKNGEITFLNSLDKEKKVKMDIKPLNNVAWQGKTSLKLPSQYIKSFLNPSTTIEELNEKYGVAAQNLALASAQAKDKEYIYNKSKENTFRNSLKVDLKNQETSIYSPNEIEEVYNKCTQEVYNLNTAKETLELCNDYRKLMYSINYYSQQESEILGKPTLHVNEETMKTFNINSTSQLEEDIASAMIKNDAVVIPENCNKKEVLCKAYLNAEGPEKIEDLKVAIDDNEQGDSTYWILNDKKWLISVNKNHTSYNNPRTDIKEINVKELLEKSQPVVKMENQNIVDNNKEVDER